MAGIFRIHNKFHRSSHHTLSSMYTQDQGVDPIASPSEPFNGIFYNNLTDQSRSYNIKTNSYEWYSTYVNVRSLSSNWDSIKTTYTTVNAFSSDWQLGYSAYATLNPLSANYNSVYTVVKANSADWSDQNLLYTNRSQENTKSKTFSGYTLNIKPDNSVDWDLDNAQVAFLIIDKNITLKNPNNQKRGGLYTLHVRQENSGGWLINFENSYKFPKGVFPTNVINKTLSGATILNFLSDGSIMFGDFFMVNEAGIFEWVDGDTWYDADTPSLGGTTWVD